MLCSRLLGLLFGCLFMATGCAPFPPDADAGLEAFFEAAALFADVAGFAVMALDDIP